MMKLLDVPIVSREQRGEGLFVLSMNSLEIAPLVQPGHFLNIRVDQAVAPLLRRPFSVSRVHKTIIEILFNVVGKGTSILASKRAGDIVSVLGPLGKPYGVRGEYDSAILVAGGLGVAPMPILTERLLEEKKTISTFLGARSAGQLAEHHLQNVAVATDNGSKGYHGTVVSLLEKTLGGKVPTRTKIFGCGPTPMLKALSALARQYEIPCEISLEGEMACGVGICQGCPVERTSGEKKYALVCTEGPIFECRDVILQ